MWCLVPFPFGQRAGGHKRPALVVSSPSHNEETGQLVIAQITGRVSGPPRPGDYTIEGWKEAGLLKAALVRARLATIAATLVFRKLGTLEQAELSGALRAVQSVLGLNPSNPSS